MEDCLDLFNNNHYPMSTYHIAKLWKAPAKIVRKALRREICLLTKLQDNRNEEILP